jgi:transketolase
MPPIAISSATITELENLARHLRLDIIETTTRAGSGHLSSSFSSVEILTALYFGGILRYRPEQPDWPDRDRFLLSKGHAAPLLYPILAHAGYFAHDLIHTLRQIDSPLQGHPIYGTLPGIEMTSGSLGQGLSIGLGHVLGGRLGGRDYLAYVLLGDGECQEGQIWEAAMAAAHFKADHLKAILDYNLYQETGPVAREMALEPLADKWRAFGWHVEEVDGHDLRALIEQLTVLKGITGKPAILIAHTVKGKGVSFVEADYTFHGKGLTPEQAEKAREELICS